MSWDIYGEPLRRGHCEVHPYVHEEYPCSVCIADKRSSEHRDCRGVEYDLYLAREHIDHLKQERDAMAAHVERLEDIIERSTLADSPAAESALEDTPETSLARLKSQWQAEALEEVAFEWRRGEMNQDDTDCVEYLERKVRRIRRQAEGG